MRFIGTIPAKADNKGRVFMPAIFRRALLEERTSTADLRLIMRKDIFEDCLVIYPEEEWYRRLDQQRERLGVWNRREQAVMRKYLTDAEWVTLDNNGRMLIPKRYMQMAGIEAEVTFVGMDSTIEIWSTPRLARHTDNNDFALSIEELMNPANDQTSHHD